MKNIKFIISFILIALLCSDYILAQNEISGTVVDAAGQTISNIALKLKNYEISTVSDAEGHFKLWLPEEIKTLEFTDYKDYRYKESKYISDSEIEVVFENIKLELFDLSLEEILDFEVSVAGKTEEKVAEIPASVIIITRKEIENYGYTSIMELLQHIVGLYMIDNYTSHNGVLGVRGIWADDHNTDNDNYAILINNIYQYSLKFALPIQAIDRVEVIRGPMSVIYGSGAMYGAINIVTNEVEENIASVSYGLNNTLSTYAGITDNKDDFKYTFNLGYDRTDGINALYKEMMGEENFSEFQFIQSNYGTVVPDDYSSEKQFEKRRTYVNFYGRFKDVYIAATHIDVYNELFFLYPAYDEGNSLNTNSTRFTLGYQKQIVPSFSINARASYGFTNDDYGYDFFADLFYGTQFSHYRHLETVLDLKYTFSNKLDIVLGGQYDGLFNYKNVTDVAGSLDPALTNRIQTAQHGNGRVGAFTQINYKPISNIKLVGGIRLEKVPAYSIEYFINGASTDSNFPPEKFTVDVEASDLIINPRLAAVYTMKNNHIFKLMFAEATQMQPLGFEPKKQRTFEFNYLFTQKKYSIGLNVFRNYFWNVINSEYLYDQETGTYSEIYTNSGNLKSTGFELNFITQPFTNFKVELGGMYQKTIDENNKSIAVAYSPDLLGQAKVLYQIQKFSFSVIAHYVDEMESLWIKDNPNTGEEGHRLGNKADSYFIVGANVRVDNIYKGLFANLRVSNLFDTEIRYPAVQTTSSLIKGTYGRGRMIFGTIGWKF